MRSKFVTGVMILACVIAGAWRWLLFEPVIQPVTAPPHVRQVNTEQPINTEQQVSTDHAKQSDPEGSIDDGSYISVRLAVDAPEPQQVELHAAVQDMLQTLISQGYPAFAEKYLAFPVLDAKPGVVYLAGENENMDPKYRALGFGDLNQLIFELESMQNSIPRYQHDTVIVIDQSGLESFHPPPDAFYDLPPFPGGPKEFKLDYSESNKEWTITTNYNLDGAGAGNVW